MGNQLSGDRLDRPQGRADKNHIGGGNVRQMHTGSIGNTPIHRPVASLLPARNPKNIKPARSQIQPDRAANQTKSYNTDIHNHKMGIFDRVPPP